MLSYQNGKTGARNVAGSSNHVMQMTKAESLIVKLESFGSSYKPSNASISLLALKDNLALNKQLVSDIQTATALFASHQIAKNNMLLELNEKVRQIQLNLTALDLEPGTLEQVKVITNNFKSKVGKSHKASVVPSLEGNASAGPDPNAPQVEAPKAPKIAQKFAERKVEWFCQLIEFLAHVPTYQPNEPELSLSSLKTYADGLNAELALWHRESENLASLRYKRLEQSKHPETGMVTLCRKAIAYAKSIYSPKTQEGKELAKFTFVRR
ncbi:MAG: hypothetical protein CFE21_17255 [Bacteroidetes bacterium B1(2017)]|nr:MAG: hypothetical protein CFE21_17255 [Bacteroidetes bacterium B1(2017)]